MTTTTIRVCLFNEMLDICKRIYVRIATLHLLLSSFHLLLFIYLEAASHCASHTGLELCSNRLALNPWRFACLCLQNAALKVFTSTVSYYNFWLTNRWLMETGKKKRILCNFAWCPPWHRHATDFSRESQDHTVLTSHRSGVAGPTAQWPECLEGGFSLLRGGPSRADTEQWNSHCPLG